MSVINADGLILGRLASIVAKRLLKGETISIVNADKAVISGSPEATFDNYKTSVDRGTRERGPYFPRRPDQIVKRTVRGMLPKKRATGIEALSRLKVYVGIPSLVGREEMSSIPEASMTRLGTIRYMYLGDLSRKLGSRF